MATICRLVNFCFLSSLITTYLDFSTRPRHTKKDHGTQSRDEKVQTPVQQADGNLPQKTLPLTDLQLAGVVAAAQTKHVTDPLEAIWMATQPRKCDDLLCRGTCGSYRQKKAAVPQSKHC